MLGAHQAALLASGALRPPKVHLNFEQANLASIVDDGTLASTWSDLSGGTLSLITTGQLVGAKSLRRATDAQDARGLRVTTHPIDYTKDFTVEFYLSVQAAGGNRQAILSTLNTTLVGFRCTVTSSGIQIYLSHSGGLSSVTLTNAWVQNQKYHIAATLNRTTNELLAWLDGAYKGKASSIGTVTIPNKLELLGDCDTVQVPPAATIDEFTVWDYMKYSKEADFTPPTGRLW